MEVLQTIREIETSDEFSRWKDVNEDAYLTSAFTMFSEGQKKEWLIGYYNEKSQKITTFAPNNQRTEEVFKKEEHIPKLKVIEVKINEEQAVEAAKGILQNNYKGDTSQRTILVLQKLDVEPLWNITFITHALKVINIKVSAVTGKGLGHNASNVSDFIKNPLDFL